MKIIFAFALAALALSSCGTRHAVMDYSMKGVQKDMQLIPAGSFQTDPGKDTVHKTVSVSSFYLCSYETPNGLYLEYLWDLRRNDTAAYRVALPDTLCWRTKMAYNEPYTKYYLRHPSYRNYPVVGVNYAQALKFCDWLTKTYNNWPDRKFKKVVFALPSETEWEYAANGGLTLSFFPWGGPNLRNSKGETLANFLRMDEAQAQRRNIDGKVVYVIEPSFENGDITAPVSTYWPNGYGLYNMAGNVEEMVSEYGITHGGSWNDPGYYLRNGVSETYTRSTETSAQRGFRFKMTVVEQ